MSSIPCGHPECTIGCPTCRWRVMMTPKGRAARELWGLPEPTAIMLRQFSGGPCKHLGGETRLHECEPCRLKTGRRTALKVFACAAHGECTQAVPVEGVKGCCQGCNEYVSASAPAPARPGDPACGVVIGCWRWPGLAELQVRLIRATCGPVPILLSDDASGKDAEFRKIEESYPDVLFRTSPERIGHAGGDVQAYRRGLLWAEKRGLKVLAKFSHRFLINVPYWLQDGGKAMLEAGKAALGQESMIEGKHWMPLRTESLLMDVERWAPVADALPNGKIHTSAECVMHHFIQVHFGPDAIGPWDAIGRDRCEWRPGILFHTANPREEYQALADRLGVALDDDYDCAGWAHRPGYVVG